MIRSATGAINERGSVAQKGGPRNKEEARQNVGGNGTKSAAGLEMEGRDVRRRVTIQSGGEIG